VALRNEDCRIKKLDLPPDVIRNMEWRKEVQWLVNVE
jgi:hypothetical protein